MRRASLVLAVLAACYSAGVKVTEKQVKNFTPGATTYADVVKALGEPTTVNLNSDGSRLAIYSFMSAAARPASFIPYVGLFAGGANVKHSTATFRFDTGGVLLDYSTSDTAIGGQKGTTAGAKTPRDADDAEPVATSEPLPTSCSESGAVRCNGSAVQTCSDKAWRTTDACATGQACSESRLYCPDGACCH